MDLLFPDEMLPVVADPGWPFGQLQPSSYDFIMADPPWRFLTYSERGVTHKGAGGQYRLMTLDDIKMLPVFKLAAPDCLLWMWATAPMLPHAIDTLRAWQFHYCTAGSWAKRTKNGKLRWGTGYRFRSTSEFILIGTRGKPKSARNVPSHVDGLAREHSRKPDEAYALAERMMPNARRADLFSRQVRPGWEGFGNEIEKFEEIAA